MARQKMAGQKMAKIKTKYNKNPQHTQKDRRFKIRVKIKLLKVNIFKF
jgi:hypothetical protein